MLSWHCRAGCVRFHCGYGWILQYVSFISILYDARDVRNTLKHYLSIGKNIILDTDIVKFWDHKFGLLYHVLISFLTCTIFCSSWTNYRLPFSNAYYLWTYGDYFLIGLCHRRAQTIWIWLATSSYSDSNSSSFSTVSFVLSFGTILLERYKLALAFVIYKCIRIVNIFWSPMA